MSKKSNKIAMSRFSWGVSWGMGQKKQESGKKRSRKIGGKE